MLSLFRRGNTAIREKFQFEGHDVLLERRPYKRSLTVTLQMSGQIRVSAARRASREQVISFLKENRAWMKRSLAKYDELRAAFPKKEYREGERFLFLGRELTLHFEKSATSHRKPRLRVEGESLICSISKNAWTDFQSSEVHPELSVAVAEFYKAEGCANLSRRMKIISEKTGLRPSSLAFRSQKTRWGSCSSRGAITLNWRLAIASEQVMDYVIVHELAHLKHHDHSIRFWREVAHHMPDFIEPREWLKRNQYSADFLANRSEIHQ